MADTKISGLPAADTLDGTEAVPIVQDGTTVKATAQAIAGTGRQTFTQSVASATWTVVHNLDRYPSVTVVDSSGNKGFGSVQYVDANTLKVSFASAFAGKAYLN